MEQKYKTFEEHPLVSAGTPSVIDIDKPTNNELNENNPFGDVKDESFFDKVCEIFGDGDVYSWEKALYIVRVERFIERCGETDPFVVLLRIYDDKKDKSAAFKNEVAKFGEIILEKDYEETARRKRMAEAREQWPYTTEEDDEESDEEYLPSDEICSKYEDPLDDFGEKNPRSLLHHLAYRGLIDLVEIYVKIYPGVMYMKEDKGGRNLPIELALLEQHDEVASFLASKMTNERVRKLFTCSVEKIRDEKGKAKFPFAELVKDPKMKETVLEILECCINPNWPFTPLNHNEEEDEWTKMKERPLQYDFHYLLLDGDQNGKPLKINVEEESQKRNKSNNSDNDSQKKTKSQKKELGPSPLQLLIEGPHSEIAIKHPVVRKLVDDKWKYFGRNRFTFHFVLYVLFIVFMGFALFLEPSEKLRSKYSTPKDYARAFFEIVTIVITMIYLFDEIDQMIKEKFKYLNFFNALDVSGIILLLVLIPLRFTGHVKAEYGVASAVFLINCLRILKYFSGNETLGVYSKTFADIIRYDILKFTTLFLVIMIGFTGCIFLAMKALVLTGNQEVVANVTFWKIALKELRALTEGNPFNDSYNDYNVVVIILIMFNMGAIIVILTNILIGQLSYRYEIALGKAGLRFSIDKAKFIMRIERSWFSQKFNDRVNCYKDSVIIDDEMEIMDLLSDWREARNKNPSTRESLREMYSKIKE